MPNTSANRLVVRGPRDELRRFKRDVAAPRGERCWMGERIHLDLDRLRPPDHDVEAHEFMEKLGDLYADPKWNTWDNHVTRITPRQGDVYELEYSFVTAWSEPIGPVAWTSRKYPHLCFVLTGMDLGASSFTSSFIRRGRVRHWEMPQKTVDKLADYCVDDEGEEYLADWQFEIGDALVAHWNGALKRTFAERSSRQHARATYRRR